MRMKSSYIGITAKAVNRTNEGTKMKTYAIKINNTDGWNIISDCENVKSAINAFQWMMEIDNSVALIIEDWTENE